jgi:hypothetical protein
MANTSQQLGHHGPANAVDATEGTCCLAEHARVAAAPADAAMYRYVTVLWRTTASRWDTVPSAHRGIPSENLGQEAPRAADDRSGRPSSAGRFECAQFTAAALSGVGPASWSLSLAADVAVRRWLCTPVDEGHRDTEHEQAYDQGYQGSGECRGSSN